MVSKSYSPHSDVQWQNYGGLRLPIIPNWLVVGPPLWKIWVRQLGWWHKPNINGKIQKMATKPPTSNELEIQPSEFAGKLFIKLTNHPIVQWQNYGDYDFQIPNHKIVRPVSHQRGAKSRAANTGASDPAGPAALAPPTSFPPSGASRRLSPVEPGAGGRFWTWDILQKWRVWWENMAVAQQKKHVFCHCHVWANRREELLSSQDDHCVVNVATILKCILFLFIPFLDYM